MATIEQSQQVKENTNNENDTGLTQKFLELDQTRQSIQRFRDWENDENENRINLVEARRNEILWLATFFENYLKDREFEYFTDQICLFIVRIFDIADLGKYTKFIMATLPEKYKNKSKIHYRDYETKATKNALTKLYSELESLDFSKIDSDTLKQFIGLDNERKKYIYSLLEERGEIVPHNYNNNNTTTLTTTTTILNKEEEDLLNRPVATTIADQRENEEWDKRRLLEKMKFKPAEVGRPLTTAEQLCQDIPGYYEVYQEMINEFDRTISIWEKMKEKYVNQYVPLNVKDCNKIIKATRVFNEMLIPFVDRKYRRNHWQMIKIARDKIETTSINAAKKSRLPCLWKTDPKTGAPIMRGLTKEQIDATYVSAVNNMIRYFNHTLEFGKLFSEVDDTHYTRGLDDRAVEAHDVLSHRA